MESSKVLRKLLKAFNLEMLDLSSKLKTGYRYENHSWNPGFTNGVRQFCGYQYFSYEILFYSLSLYSPFLLNLINQNQVSFNDTLLNFGLCGFIKRSSTSRLHITQFHWPTVDKHTFQLFYYIYIYRCMGLDCKDRDGIVQSQACMLSHLPTTVFFLLRHALFSLYSLCRRNNKTLSKIIQLFY